MAADLGLLSRIFRGDGMRFLSCKIIVGSTFFPVLWYSSIGLSFTDKLVA
ncbi:hypothetical protein BRCON_2051 [Candidatus Sumerlaea chitinivorans]|uniref:Uncharacterized protein n=1 Tax=Sumerlaea chitinivorans TaxID=2250252 RepID=A0A2Z4Y7K7_SUMC1|nr:hypothetical protein BRCON_2051 [Candidatus Sumerlaea chitinivorans]